MKNSISLWAYPVSVALAASVLALVLAFPHQTHELSLVVLVWGAGLTVMSVLEFRRFTLFHRAQDGAWALVFAVLVVLLLGVIAVIAPTPPVIAA